MHRESLQMNHMRWACTLSLCYPLLTHTQVHLHTQIMLTHAHVHSYAYTCMHARAHWARITTWHVLQTPPSSVCMMHRGPKAPGRPVCVLISVRAHTLALHAYMSDCVHTCPARAQSHTEQKWHTLKCTCCVCVITLNSHCACIWRFSGCTIHVYVYMCTVIMPVGNLVGKYVYISICEEAVCACFLVSHCLDIYVLVMYVIQICRTIPGYLRIAFADPDANRG